MELVEITKLFLGYAGVVIIAISTLALLFSHRPIKKAALQINNAAEDTDFAENTNHQFPLYFILSQSGGGKDTQVEKMISLLTAENVKVLYVSMGDFVRKYQSESTFFGKQMKEINTKGKLQPAAIPVHFFLSEFLTEYTGEELIIINGSPRSLKELDLWSELITAGYLPKARIVHLEVTDDECRERLKNRPNRPDTEDDAARETKLGWYKPIRRMLEEKLPAGISLVPINGMQHQDEVFKEIEKLLVRDDVIMSQS